MIISLRYYILLNEVESNFLFCPLFYCPRLCNKEKRVFLSEYLHFQSLFHLYG